MSLAHLHGREKNLAQFGWTAQQAEWVALVCLHSGCFLRSQFSYYLQIDRMAVSRFVGAMAAEDFAVEVKVITPTGAPYLCRISSRQIYRALGAENIRHRRGGDARTTLIRVLGLDYILENPTYHWLPTEHDKVDYFHSKLKIPTKLLPSRVYGGNARHQVRFFVSKYPIAYEKNTVTFLYIDPNDVTDAPLRSWLKDYLPLFHTLRDAGKRVRVVVVASDRKVLMRADRILCRWSKAQPVLKNPDPVTDEARQIQTAFHNDDFATLAKWGGLDGALARITELEAQAAAGREPTEEPIAKLPLDNHSLWHSSRLTGIDFEGLRWRTDDP